MTDEAEEDLTGTLVAGRYRLVAPLGRGGMGAVYRGVQEGLERKVAVKVMRSKTAESRDGLERFRREASTAARLGHPNIVQVTDFGEAEDGSAFLVMELLEGRSLGEILAEEAPLQPARVLDIATQVCDALEAAHGAGVVHRDLKPPNVFVVPLGGGRELVKLLDFGVAKLVDYGDYARLTATGTIIGTPAYMAPEQLLGLEVDPRADLYSLGVIMYEALAGRRLFGALAGVELMAAILERTPVALGELRPDLDPALIALVETAMAKDPASRFTSATAMRGALEELAGPPVVDAPPRPMGEDSGMPPTAATSTAPGPGATPGVSDRPSSARRWIGVVAVVVALLAGLVVAVLVSWPTANEEPTSPVTAVGAVAGTQPVAPVALEAMEPSTAAGSTDGSDGASAMTGEETRRVAMSARGRDTERGRRGAGAPMRETPAVMLAPAGGEPYVFVPDYDVRHEFHTFGDYVTPVRLRIARCLGAGYVVPDPEPRVCVALDLSAGGSVSRIQRLPGGVRDQTFDDCVTDNVGMLQMGETRSGQPVTIDICFAVRPEL